MWQIRPGYIVVAVEIYSLCLLAALGVDRPRILSLEHNVVPEIAWVLLRLDVVEAVNVEDWHDVELDSLLLLYSCLVAVIDTIELLKQDSERHLNSYYLSRMVQAIEHHGWGVLRQVFVAEHTDWPFLKRVANCF